MKTKTMKKSVHKTRAAALRFCRAMRVALDRAEVSAAGNDPELAAVDICFGLQRVASETQYLRAVEQAY